MTSSPHSLDPVDKAAFLERLRQAGLADVERGLREGRYEGDAAHVARSWVKIKKMEIGGRPGAIAGDEPSRTLARVLRKLRRIPLSNWRVLLAMLAAAIGLAGWAIFIR
jgi:hypothetical protein